jgi:SAM-dependent methyltransferase
MRALQPSLLPLLFFLVVSASLCAEDKKDKKDRKPDVVYIPTPQPVVEKMLEAARVGKDDVVYDLGCGDGRIVLAAARKFKCKAVGYDIDPERIKDCEANKSKESKEVQKLVSFEKKDIFTLDLGKATVIMLYLQPFLNAKLIPQLEKLKPGSRIISHAFPIKGVVPDKGFPIKVADDEGFFRLVYRWTAPLKVAGKE